MDFFSAAIDGGWSGVSGPCQQKQIIWAKRVMGIWARLRQSRLSVFSGQGDTPLATRRVDATVVFVVEGLGGFSGYFATN